MANNVYDGVPLPRIEVLLPTEWPPYIYWIIIALLLVTYANSAISSTFNVIERVWRAIEHFFRRDERHPIIETAPERIRILRTIWLRDRNPQNVDKPPPPRHGKPVISLLNMKGGVGKTTIAANIGAYFSSLKARVLFVDFDYQGTLSLMVASAAGMDRLEANSSSLLYPQSEDSLPVYQLGGNLRGCGLYAAHYVLFRDEMELFANWVAGRSEFDIRYSMAENFNNEGFMNYWDVAIVDCGPRFTTSTINAFCASTHLIIPSILDEASTQAVGYLSKEIDDHRSDLFPRLRLLGVIPTMIAQDPPRRHQPLFSDTEQEQLAALRDAVRRTWGDEDLVLDRGRVPRRMDISRTADRIAYFERNNDAKRIFGRLGGVLIEKLQDEGFSLAKEP